MGINVAKPKHPGFARPKLADFERYVMGRAKRYVMGRLLGEGAYSAVYEAIDQEVRSCKLAFSDLLCFAVLKIC